MFRQDGTLTLNKLTLDEVPAVGLLVASSQLTSRQPVAFGKSTPDAIIFDAALASHKEDNDALDIAIIENCKDAAALADYKCLHFVPFNPTDKRTEAQLQSKTGQIFWTSKGAPQTVLKMCTNKAEVQAEVDEHVEDFAKRGYRALGVAHADVEGQWVFAGLIPLFDPPRADTADTINKALHLGVRVKMITGDQLAIAKETARRLGMASFPTTRMVARAHPNLLPAQGFNIFTPDQLENAAQFHLTAAQLVEEADGFAQVRRRLVAGRVSDCGQGVPGAQVRDREEAAEGEAHGGHDGRRRQRRPRPEACRHRHCRGGCNRRRARRLRHRPADAGSRRHHRRHHRGAQDLPAHEELRHLQGAPSVPSSPLPHPPPPVSPPRSVWCSCSPSSPSPTTSTGPLSSWSSSVRLARGAPAT